MSAVAAAETISGPECSVRFPAHARRQAERIIQTFARRRAAASEWLGIPIAGHPRIVLVNDYEGMQREAPGAPEWAVAVARRDDKLVFRLDRIGNTPTTSLDLVLKHEIVHHVVTHLGGRPLLRSLPRWFEEGLCVSHAGVAYFEPDTSLERTAAGGNLPRLAAVDELFRKDGRSAALAYRIGHAVVTAFRDRFGSAALRRLIDGVARGKKFEDAFAAATAVSFEDFENDWRKSVTPRLPLWLYLPLQNIELTLLCLGALAVVLGYVRWRFRRERAMASLGGEG